jgi:hypothetical protein
MKCPTCQDVMSMSCLFDLYTCAKGHSFTGKQIACLPISQVKEKK